MLQKICITISTMFYSEYCCSQMNTIICKGNGHIQSLLGETCKLGGQMFVFKNFSCVSVCYLGISNSPPRSSELNTDFQTMFKWQPVFRLNSITLLILLFFLENLLKSTYYSRNYSHKKDLFTKIHANLLINTQHYIQLQITTLNRYETMS